MTAFRTAALKILAYDLDGPHNLTDDHRDKLLALLGESFTEQQLQTLEETLSNLADRCFTARRRSKGAREWRERIAGMTDEEILGANPTRSLAGALAIGRLTPLHVLQGGDAA